VNSVLFPAATTVSALAADALTIGSLTVGEGSTFTVPGGKTLIVTDSLVIGSAGNTVTLTKATLTAATGTGITADGTAGTLVLGNNGDSLALANGGTIEVVGQTASIELPNTVFKAGTYTAAGGTNAAVTIAANSTSGDTITTGANGGATDKLTFGTLVMGEITGANTASAVYTFKKNDPAKVQLSTNTITVPDGASVTANNKAGITLAAGTIGLGNGATLVLTAGATIGVFTGDGSDNVASIAPHGTDASKSGSVDDARISGADTSLANSGGTLTAATTGTANPTLTGAADGSSIAAGVTLTAAQP
jgi:hypothetical protein